MKIIAEKKQFIYSLLTVFVPLCIITGSILFYLYTTETETNNKIIRAEELSKITIQEQLISKSFREIIGDLKLIRELHEIQKSANNMDFDVKGLSNDYYHLSIYKGLYDQIRYLDQTGKEKIRINYNKGTPLAVKKDNLQNKKNRYYFQDTIKLKKNEVYISPIDLNIEHGQIETPLKPMIRFGALLLNRNGDKRGIVLLNYSASILINDLEKLGNGLGSFSFLNSEGYWLKTSGDKNGWGFLYKDRKDMTFGNKYPFEWKKMLGSDSEQIQSKKGLFTFTTFYPLKEEQKPSSGSAEIFTSSQSVRQGNQYFFKLVSYVPNAILMERSQIFFDLLFRLFLVLNILFFLVAITFAKFRINRKRYQEERKHERIQKEKLQGVLEMAGAVCHEINQPLMVISGFSELLLEDLPEGESLHEIVLEINTQIDRLSMVTGKLMNISRYRTRSYLKGNIIDIDEASDEK